MTNDNPIITSPVLIPYTPDCEYEYGEEVLPPEKIEHLANSFNDYKIIDLQHEFTKRLINHLEPIPRGKLLKSYISREDIRLKGLDGYTREYPVGTWIISVEITDPEAMKLYEQGVLTGLSITVKEREHADTIIEFLNDNNIPYLPTEIVEAEKGFYKKPKRILMKDVINPVAFTVSLVKQPCVYGAKFCRNSCLIVNEEKLKENKILNLKEKIKSEINNIIDGLDVEEAIKEDIVEESEKEEVEVTVESTEESEKEEVTPETNESEESEAVKEEDGGDNESDNTENGDSENDGENTETTTDGSGEDGDEDNGTAGEKTKKEVRKEDVTTESDKSESKKCGGEKTKTIYGRKVKAPEVKKEDVQETSAETESDKEVLYLAQDDVENLISTTLRRYAEEVEQMVFDGIQEALDDYLFSSSYKEDVKEEEEEEEVEEVQKQYATPEMVQSMFDEQFGSFKSTIMEGIHKAQKESIKSYSKAITPSDDGFEKEAKKEASSFKPRVERDFNGCRIRKR